MTLRDFQNVDVAFHDVAVLTSESRGGSRSPALASMLPVSLLWQEKQNLTAHLPNTRRRGETEFRLLNPCVGRAAVLGGCPA